LFVSFFKPSPENRDTISIEAQIERAGLQDVVEIRGINRTVIQEVVGKMCVVNKGKPHKWRHHRGWSQGDDKTIGSLGLEECKTLPAFILVGWPCLSLAFRVAIPGGVASFTSL
jgi:hypothetical protein